MSRLNESMIFKIFTFVIELQLIMLLFLMQGAERKFVECM